MTKIDLIITSATDYFNEVDKEIDWDGDSDNPNEISYEQADDITKIISTEFSLYLLRRTSGVCGSLVDSMDLIRQRLMMNYEETWQEEYIEYNNELL